MRYDQIVNRTGDKHSEIYETGGIDVLVKTDLFKDCLAVSGENKYFELKTLREVRKKLNCSTKSEILSDTKIAFACSIHTCISF